MQRIDCGDAGSARDHSPLHRASACGGLRARDRADLCRQMLALPRARKTEERLSARCTHDRAAWRRFVGAQCPSRRCRRKPDGALHRGARQRHGHAAQRRAHDRCRGRARSPLDQRRRAVARDRQRPNGKPPRLVESEGVGQAAAARANQQSDRCVHRGATCTGWSSDGEGGRCAHAVSARVFRPHRSAADAGGD